MAVESTDQHMSLVNCGSSEVDEAFIRYVQNMPAANNLPSGPFSQKAIDIIVDQFLHLKEGNRTRPIFKPEYPCLPESAYFVFPKGYRHLQVENSELSGYMTIGENHWETFFHSPVRSIIELLRKYIYSCLNSGIRITEVFLVGGFGRSFYLRETVKQNLPGVYVYASGASEMSFVYGPHDTHVTLCSLADMSVPETIKVSSGVYDELLE